MACDKHAFSFRQKMADQIRYRVRFARTRRTLHQHGVPERELSGDFQLFPVGFFGQKNPGTFSARRRQLFLNRLFRFHAGNFRLFVAHQRQIQHGRGNLIRLFRFFQIIQNQPERLTRSVRAFSQQETRFP